MTYDIGIGVCSGIEGNTVVVSLDSAIVSKLIPNQPWRKSGTSVLRLRNSLCSSKRPPQVGDEVYLERAALTRTATATLDLFGDGEPVSVELIQLLTGLDPQPPVAVAVGKGRARRW
jgi:hypothetical protein